MEATKFADSGITVTPRNVNVWFRESHLQLFALLEVGRALCGGGARKR